MARPATQTTSHLRNLVPPCPPAPPRPAELTVIIPTIASSPTLDTVIRGILWQRVPTTILLIDTGSTLPQYFRLEKRMHQRPVVQLLRIVDRPWAGLSARVAAALDIGIALCETKLAILTHDDVFLKHRDVFNHLQHDHNSRYTIATGYEMSPRSHITDQWKGMVSHTLTMIDVKEIREKNVRWSLNDARLHKDCEHHGPAWPDTETGFGLAMRDLGFTPNFIGHETNEPHFEDANIVHRRSLTSHRFLWPDLANKDVPWQQETIQRFEALYDGN